MMKLEIAARTEVGEVRDHNEDNYLVNPDLVQDEWFYSNDIIYRPGEKGTLLIVADGMGGMNAGEVASRIAVDSLKDYFRTLDLIPVEEVGEAMRQGIIYANERLVEHSRRHPETEKMGTTLVMAWLRDEMVHVCWVGDSRAYLLREDEWLRPISHDHSLVEQWIQEGKLTQEEAFYHPQNNIVTQSLGDSGRIPQPDYERHKLQAGDTIILCSDGLNNMLMDDEIESILKKDHPKLKAKATELADAAVKAGGHDNITLVLVGIKEANGILDSISIDSVKKPKVPENRTIIRLVIVILFLILSCIGGYWMFFHTKKDDPSQVKEKQQQVDEANKNKHPPQGPIQDSQKDRVEPQKGQQAKPDRKAPIPKKQKDPERNIPDPPQEQQSKQIPKNQSAQLPESKEEIPDPSATKMEDEEVLLKELEEREETVLVPVKGKNNKYGYKREGAVGETDRFIIKPKFDQAQPFSSSGYAVVSKNGRTFLINKKGKQQ